MKGLKNTGRKVISVFLAVVMTASLCISGIVYASGTVCNASFSVQYQQTEARKLQTEINNFRTGDDTWYWNSDDTTKTDVVNLSSLTYDYDLEKIAMQRASEISLYYDHTRPDGTSFDTALSGYSYSSPAGECIYAGAGYYGSSASAVITALKEEDENFSGQADRRNMLSEEYSRIGCACVYVNNTYYWVVLMVNSTNSSSSTTANDSTTTVTVPILEERLFFNGTSVSNMALKLNESQNVPNLTMYVRPTYTAGSYDGIQVSINGSDLSWSSSNTNVATVSNGKVNAVGIPSGSTSATATISTTVNGTSVSFTVTVTETVTHVERVDSTCTTQGHVEYWYIEETGQYFSNSGLTNEVSYSDLILPLADHNYQEISRTEATCLTNGSVSYKCSVCGNSYSDTIQALGHNYVSTTVPASCEENGSITYVCSRCQDTYSEIIFATGHDWDDGVITKEPTYTEDGEITYTCKNCGATRTAVIEHEEHTHNWSGAYEFHWDLDTNGIPTGATCTFICSECGEQETVKCVLMSKVSTEASCVTTGIMTYTISAESPDGSITRTDSRDVIIPAIGHNYQLSGHVDSTCKDNGYDEYTCVNCGDTYFEELSLSEEHVWDNGVVIKEATTTEDGEMLYTCTICGITKVEAISAMGDDPEPSPSEEPSPSPSEEPEPSPSEHEHEWTPVFAWSDNYTSCIVSFYCDNCDEVEGPFDCAISQAGSVVTASYEFEGKTYTDSVNIEIAEPTYEFIWSDDYSYCYLSVINSDGSTETVLCNVGWCTIVEPTCKSVGIQGWYAWYGDVISDPVKYEEIPVTEHTWNDGVIVKEATETENGEILYTCTVCGAQKAETIPATGTSEPEPTPEHKWIAEFDWSGDLDCKVTFTCEDCGEIEGPFICEIFGSDEGSIAYYEFEGNIYYDIKDFSGHQFVWNDDYTECLIYITLPNGAIYAEQCEVGWITITEPTCVESGEQGLCAWYEDYISDFVKYEEIQPLGHDYQKYIVIEPTCTEEGYTVYRCSRCNAEYTSNYVEALGHEWDNGVITKEATATEDGEILYTCQRCGVEKTEIIPALGDEPEHEHNWEAVFTWSDDYSECTVIFVCSDCDETAGPFDCKIEIAGTLVTAYYEFEGKVYYSDSVNLNTEGIQYVFTWNDDYTECEITIITEDGATQYAECEVGWIVIKEPTCTETGERMWCAWYNDITSDPVYIEEISAIGHNWVSSFVWSDDYSSCILHLDCSICNTEIDISCAITYKEYDSYITYTATTEYNGLLYTDEKIVPKESVPTPTPEFEYEFVWNDDYSACEFVITWDDGITESYGCEIGWLIILEPTCTKAGEQGLYAWYENYISDPVTTETIPATGHEWSVQYTWSEDYLECTAIFTCSVCGVVDSVSCSITEKDGVYTAECVFDNQIWITTATASQSSTEEHERLVSELEQLIQDMYVLLSESVFDNETEEELLNMISRAEALLESDATDEELTAMIQEMSDTIIALKENDDNSDDDNDKDSNTLSNNNDSDNNVDNTISGSDSFTNDSTGDINSADSEISSGISVNQVSVDNGDSTDTATETNSNGSVSNGTNTEDVKTGDGINTFTLIGIISVIALMGCWLIPTKRKKV